MDVMFDFNGQAGVFSEEKNSRVRQWHGILNHYGKLYYACSQDRRKSEE
jgi:hypothetical protein